MMRFAGVGQATLRNTATMIPESVIIVPKSHVN